MINIKSKSISFIEGDHVNKSHFLPTWLKDSVDIKYYWLESLIKIDDTWGEEYDVEDTSFIGWWSYKGLSQLQSLAHHVLMVFDAYEIGYPLDRPPECWAFPFSVHCLLDSENNKRDNDNTFQAWCKIYDKKAFNKKKSYNEWQSYYETNIYAFRKVCQLTLAIYELFEFKCWEDMYNWCLDVYNGKHQY